MTGSNSNKILTVSYGTFSCTLEGFDDPFGTMRGIAEYFRDLAADDRYFGAEPPTPDVEMLQNIAQKEVHRRVDARMGDSGVALRQMESASEVPPEPMSPDATSVPDAEMLESGPLAFDDEYLMSDEPEDILTVDASAPPSREPAQVETVAEKLRRIRAVVSRSIEPEEPGQSFSDAQALNAGAAARKPQKRNRALSETIASITADLADEDDVDQFATLTESNAVDVETESSEKAESDKFHSSMIADILADDASDTQASEADLADEHDDVVEDEATRVEFDAAADQEEEPVVIDTPVDTEDQSEASVNDEVAAKAVDAQVDELEEEIDGSDAPAPPAISERGDEGDETDVSALLSNVAARGLVDPVETQEVEAVSETERRVSKPLEPIGESNGDVGRLLKETDDKFAEDDSVRRRRVISQMRAAVAATKADRIFSKIVSRDTEEKQEQSPYRSDLDRAISRTPDVPTVENASENTSEPAKPERPAPLVLVSSQRVDEFGEDADDVRPQRVEKKSEIDPETSDFKEFAADMGARELPDLLEAAAAYSVFIEGQPHFSRPEIMKRVARVDPALQVSREAGLRSFGQLLRQGKIRKLQRGQFAVADDSRFNPAQRIAGE